MTDDQRTDAEKFNSVIANIRYAMNNVFTVDFITVKNVTEKYGLEFAQWPPRNTYNNVTILENMDDWWYAIRQKHSLGENSLVCLRVLVSILHDLAHPSAEIVQELVGGISS